ncbi:virus protein phiCh1-VP68 (plasmid) [Natrialba magadii ATCC 43099]|uniref:Virus protein phiCh1-VP68 n=3 Tax=root TaxID=1 RepID=D3T2B9_NATMM|nr:hypothetical protein [Natrialba magadii]YP_010078094.1 uncharacterized protein KMC42_gp64 [Natrialba phage PhiCh1]ADD07728.1 virus protein phiCh1-VP68 [Natrialba magadii ATCC 43099]ELY22975.1 hypothetical protein C500_20965 [Natrialba magadii ATCC 43099]QBJ01245.1 uncharacterized protein PhiCh1_315 [Natrialba phage PhiCh1]
MTSEELNRLAFERDLALRQAKLSKADLQVIQLALNENRPLEALYTVNNAIERLDEELDAIEEFPNETQADPREGASKEGEIRENVPTREVVDDWLWEQYDFGLKKIEEEYAEFAFTESPEEVDDAR